MKIETHDVTGNARLQSESELLQDDSSISFIQDGCRDVVPFAGNRNGTDIYNEGSNGYYWSGTLNEDNENNAYEFEFNMNDGNLDYNWNDNNNRENGLSVRPVSEFIGNSSAPFRTDPDTLLLDLYRAFKDARRHKRKKTYVLKFSLNLEKELISLRDDILNRRYIPRPCRCFIIRDPKLREVFAADFRDRIVHHLYYNYMRELFERSFIHDSYSCIKGRGTHWGIRRLKHHIRSVSCNYTKECYVLKLDIKGYFMHIDRSLLLDICRTSISRMGTHPSNKPGKTWAEVLDMPLMDYLTETIIMNNPLEGCRKVGDASDWYELPVSKSLFHSPRGCGLPIGNLTSQLFSNVYMNLYDQFCKRILKCQAYGRYVDDSYIVSNHKEELRNMSKEISSFLLNTLKLEINRDKTRICNIRHGVGFLGAYIRPYRTYMQINTLKRIRKSIKELESVTDPHSIFSSVNSYLGALSHCYSYRIRMSIINDNRHLFRYGYFGKSGLTYRLRRRLVVR